MVICVQLTIEEPVIELTAFSIVEVEYIPEADNVKLTYTVTGKCTLQITKNDSNWFTIDIPSEGNWASSAKLSPGTHNICASVI